MKASARRRLEGKIQDIMRSDGDRCSICKKPFAANSRTFGGATKHGDAALAGECCTTRMGITIIQGVYLSKQDFGELQDSFSGSGDAISPEAIDHAITSLQGFANNRRQQRETAERRAGIGPTRLSTEANEWKADDAAWFAAHPARSHRLRRLVGNEGASFPEMLMPEGHELQVLVRQIEPGARVRAGFARNLSVAIPDYEACLHGLFDLLNGSEAGHIITAADVLMASLMRKPPTDRKH